jgi:cell division septum initiation protein DivIVA
LRNVSANPRGGGLLEDVSDPARRYIEAEEQRQQAREELRTKIPTACDTGIPFAAIARAAGISRERMRQLYAGR